MTSAFCYEFATFYYAIFKICYIMDDTGIPEKQKNYKSRK